MPALSDVSELLRPGLLGGVRVLVAADKTRAPVEASAASDTRDSLADSVMSACEGLGAGVYELGLRAGGDLVAEDAAVSQAVAGALSALGGADLLVVDAASVFSAEGEDGRGGGGALGLVRAMEASWRVTQALANAAFIERGAAGRIVYIAPSPQAGAHAEATRAGLENLARTLSIEWARYGIMPTAIAPATDTSPGELAALCGYLASPAGAYFSGCLLDLRGPGGAVAASGS